ncbi:orotidine-5'-phosphate decarboxylase [Scopulibacillus darangshiensis]|uniref:Orotidine 5'-phosphate decarboxylase n=1 Tax=Scopulibacillus darangshiensis TaxID=442528 RepID=A0A4R2P325_9BACL|nr:orotidine-5'-phosphate decarboxylase [Scopulibacillus darangshiensis]TCP29120.1 orotidine-5'-phosphate decarboxylase [Scopulibacillus darangshiensis]
MSKDIIIALDVASKEEMRTLLDKINPSEPLYVKVGMELFYQEGLDLVKELKSNDHKVFLDLKLHDIPTTVKKAMRGLAKLNVDMVNVHAAGGSEMMKAALEGLEEGTSNNKRPICLAVTQLTSTDQAMLENEVLIDKPLNDVIGSYGQTAYASGLDGVVCSPWEAKLVKNGTSPDFLTVTPGIRLASDSVNDQKRVATPGKAKELGCDYIVVGRSIIKAQDPRFAYEKVLTEWRTI